MRAGLQPAASRSMVFVIVSLSHLGLAAAAAAAADAGRWYACTAWGSSHTGKYTFRIATHPCSVYWKEIAVALEILKCEPPRILAVKPYAVANGYTLEFDLRTGRFEDSTPVWSDRGRCNAVSTVPNRR
jgi:hypothetical protein